MAASKRSPDVLLVNPGSRSAVYQQLGEDVVSRVRDMAGIRLKRKLIEDSACDVRVATA